MDESTTVTQKSRQFAVRVIRLYQYLCSEKKEFVLSKQLLRSGTSIGANIAESACAFSNSLQKCILHLRNVMKHYTGSTYSMIQIIWLKMNTFPFMQTASSCIKCWHPSQKRPPKRAKYNTAVSIFENF